ncbi:hypothetical protein ACHAQH_000272 [Verticillium albo-atrum]
MGDNDKRTPDLSPGIVNPTASLVNDAATQTPSPFGSVTTHATATTHSTGSSDAEPTGKSKAVEWAREWNPVSRDRVFSATAKAEAFHSINLLLENDLVITRGEWSCILNDKEEKILVTTDIEQTRLPNQADNSGTRARQTGQEQFPLDVKLKSTVFPLGLLSSQPDAYGKDMFLNLTWQYNGQTGWSKSGVFTVAEAGNEQSVRDKMQNRDPEDFETEENLPDAVSRLFGGTNVSPTRLPSSTPTVGLTSNPSATGISSSDDNDSDSSNGGGGLSIGAKAGIGVGAGLVGLALFAALIWFFCLRNRRKNKNHVRNTPYSAGGHVSEYMVNKETTSGAHVTESPHSPYSDDGSLAQQQYQHQPVSHSVHEGTALVGGAAAAATSGRNPERQSDGQDRGFSEATLLAALTPRSDSQQQQHESTRSGARSTTPQGVNPNVSHLIEDGMTEDEIRRLEDEERQLDAAIEQHGNGRHVV